MSVFEQIVLGSLVVAIAILVVRRSRSGGVQ